MIRAAKINVYLRLMEQLGFKSSAVLAHTHIDTRTLLRPDDMVTRESYYAVIMNLLKLSGNPRIAFSLGSFIDISDFGILGYAMLSSTNVGQMVRIRQQYHSTMFGTMINIGSAVPGLSGYEMTISSTALTETLRRFETEEFLVEGRRLLKIMTGMTSVIRSISFSYPEPTYAETYKLFFKCPIEFGAPQTVFRVQSPGFETPIPTGNAELHSVCAQHCEGVMKLQPESGHLRSRLRDLFLNGPGSLPDLPTAAAKLGISERHLRRKLQAEGLSFQDLKDEFRFDLARQFLVTGQMAPKEVAYLLGYSGSSAFSRAFKLWTGKTVNQFLASSR